MKDGVLVLIVGTNINNYCPICENPKEDKLLVCTSCGYNFAKELIDDPKLKSCMSEIKRLKNWPKEVSIKKNLTDLKIKQCGFASTNPKQGGWSSKNTADFFNESRSTTSNDIKLAENITKYPELKNCKNKNEAKKLSEELNSGIKRNIFDSEDLLQRYLSINWKDIPFFNDWEIQTLGSGKFNTREIGEIDFLAKHKSQPKWLIVELKQDQSSDDTVGQILRYMGWVKEKHAEQGCTVEGLIIAGSDDKRIQYALIYTRNVAFKTYQIENGKFILTDPKHLKMSTLNNLSKNECNKLIKLLESKD